MVYDYKHFYKDSYERQELYNKNNLKIEEIKEAYKTVMLKITYAHKNDKLSAELHPIKGTMWNMCKGYKGLLYLHRKMYI